MSARMVLFGFLCAFLILPAATAQAINPFGRSGFDLTRDDIALLNEATKPFFDDADIPVGTVRKWNNSRSGNGGSAMLLDRFKQGGMPCRRIQHDIKVRRVRDPFRFIIDRCLVADGTWKML